MTYYITLTRKASTSTTTPCGTLDAHDDGMYKYLRRWYLQIFAIWAARKREVKHEPDYDGRDDGGVGNAGLFLTNFIETVSMDNIHGGSNPQPSDIHRKL